jgi:hypothetical protein
MFALVNRRFLRKIALVLVAAQMLSAPLASAFASLTPAADASHCTERMPAGNSHDECPCCPDGGMNASACLSACTASVGWIPVLVSIAAPAAADGVASAPPARLAALVQPPLKPPPLA